MFIIGNNKLLEVVLNYIFILFLFRWVHIPADLLLKLLCTVHAFHNLFFTTTEFSFLKLLMWHHTFIVFPLPLFRCWAAEEERKKWHNTMTTEHSQINLWHCSSFWAVPTLPSQFFISLQHPNSTLLSSKCDLFY